MSDLMLLGVLRMPIDPNSGPVALTQFFARAREAADRIESDAAEIERLRAALAQPPAPTAQQCTCPSGDGSLRWPCPQHPANIAQPVQQPGAEPDEFLGLPFNEAKTRILALDAESARGMAISFMIQLGLLQKYAAPAQRQPLSDEQIDSLTFQFLTAELGPTAYDRAIARAIEAAHNITAAPAAQKGEKL